MRRPLLLAAAFLVVATLLAACGDDTTPHMNNGSSPMGSSPMGSSGMGSSPMGSSPMGSSGMGMGSMGHGGNSAVVDGARRIEVTARSFAFSPAEITVQAGEDVTIVLTSKDLLHDFTIDALETHVAADAGGTAEGGLRADKPGRYVFYCTVAGHRAAGMEGTLVVE